MHNCWSHCCCCKTEKNSLNVTFQTTHDLIACCFSFSAHFHQGQEFPSRNLNNCKTVEEAVTHSSDPDLIYLKICLCFIHVQKGVTDHYSYLEELPPPYLAKVSIMLTSKDLLLWNPDLRLLQGSSSSTDVPLDKLLYLALSLSSVCSL